MKAVSTFIFILIASTCLHAEELFYKVSDIPAELKKNAKAIIRTDENIFEVTSVGKAVLKVTYAITVLNKNGIEDANFYEYYDKFRSIIHIKGRVFDEYGGLIKKIAPDEIDDYSAISGFSVFEDHRVKFIDPEIRTVPFTVEYTYEIYYNGLYQYPMWIPQNYYNIAVEKSSFKVIMQIDFGFRYYESNIPTPVALSSDDKLKTFYWEALNLKALEKEPFSPPEREFFPLVLMAPTDFEIGGYAGNAETWTGLGDWYCLLKEGRDVLPPETISYIKVLIKDCSDDYSRIRKIYEYMQGKVRYVNIATGIGGWQPMAAADVDRLSYGDCKALTNYMQALLNAAGIKSFYCPVYSGDSQASLITSFPSSQSNHIILCVPLEPDTLWLECTSQRSPCGYIGSFTDDRDVLLVEKSKSKIVRTRKYGLDDNIESTNAYVKIDAAGNGGLTMKTVYKGLFYDEILDTYLADDADKKKNISENLIFPSFRILASEYKETREIIPSIEEILIIDFENYLTNLNSKFLLQLNCTNKIKYSPPNVRNRKTDIVIRHPFRDFDTVYYELPVELKVESLPAPVHIVTEFGEYRSGAEIKEDRLVYYRYFVMNKGVFPASKYIDLIDFFDKMTMADDMKCILVSK